MRNTDRRNQKNILASGLQKGSDTEPGSVLPCLQGDSYTESVPVTQRLQEETYTDFGSVVQQPNTTPNLAPKTSTKLGNFNKCLPSYTHANKVKAIRTNSYNKSGLGAARRNIEDRVASTKAVVQRRSIEGRVAGTMAVVQQSETQRRGGGTKAEKQGSESPRPEEITKANR